MDQPRLDFKLNFFFLKNLKLNLYFYTFFEHPVKFINFLYSPLPYDFEFFNKNRLRCTVDINNNLFVKKNFTRSKKIKCKKIFLKKKYFVNLLYF